MRRLLVFLLGMVFPACSGDGVEGLPVPALMDFSHLGRPATPNTALAAPAGFAPPPDIVTARRAVPPPRSSRDPADRGRPAAHLRAVACVNGLQAQYVARSAVFNFPDLVTVQVLPRSRRGSFGPAASMAVPISA